MTTKSILAAVALGLVPLAASVPASAEDGDGLARTWTGNSGSGNAVPHKRGPATTNHTTNMAHTTTTSHTATASADRDSPRVTYNRDDNDDHDRGYRRHDDDGLDPAEVARIRRAHEDSDGHVYMRRDRDDDGTPAYRSGYATTYNGYEPPHRHHRRHHWWAFWY